MNILRFNVPETRYTREVRVSVSAAKGQFVATVAVVEPSSAPLRFALASVWLPSGNHGDKLFLLREGI